ncbi:Hypothetical protein, putative, partial [Bodo saltans]
SNSQQLVLFCPQTAQCQPARVPSAYLQHFQPPATYVRTLIEAPQQPVLLWTPIPSALSSLSATQQNAIITGTACGVISAIAAQAVIAISTQSPQEYSATGTQVNLANVFFNWVTNAPCLRTGVGCVVVDSTADSPSSSTSVTFTWPTTSLTQQVYVTAMNLVAFRNFFPSSSYTTEFASFQSAFDGGDGAMFLTQLNVTLQQDGSCSG